jgi:hypothetical protein
MTDLSPDFRALCAELLEVIEGEYDGTGLCYELRDRARTALATPPLEPPTAIGPEWQPCVKLPITVHVREQRPGETHSSTREGITPLRPDDLIMRGVQGEEYPIGRELFNQTYHMGEALATPPPEPPTDEGLQKSEVYNEEFWRKHALEQLLHASTSYRLGVYSSEELKLYEKRAQFFLDRWPQAKPPEPPTDEELINLWIQWQDVLSFARAVLERWGHC